MVGPSPSWWRFTRFVVGDIVHVREGILYLWSTTLFCLGVAIGVLFGARIL